MSEPYFFYINGMSCVSCSNTIESFLKNSESIKLHTFNVDLTTPDPKKATIILNEANNSDALHQSTWKKLKELIEDTGFNCESYEHPPIKEQNIPPSPSTTLASSASEKPNRLKNLIDMGKKIITSHWFLGGLGCITGISLLTLFLTIGALPLAAMIPIAGLSVILTLVLGARSYYEAWNKLRKARTLTMDTLFAISTISVLTVSLLSFFVPWLPMMFEAGLLIYGFRHIGLAIEETIKAKISSGRFQDRASKKVMVHLLEGLKETPLALIKIDDIILIQPGEIIPVDGYCEDDSVIYNTIITGAILPRHFRSGEKILAGMRLAEDALPLKIKVRKPASQSYLARLDAGIAQSLNEKAPIEIKTGKILTYFIPTIIALAVASGLLIGLFFPVAIAIQCAISVLVSACPCTLGLIIPLAVKTGIQKAAEHGVQFKNSKILQEVEQIDTIVFDLNGTLTTGVPTVKNYSLCENSSISQDEFLGICASLEQDSLHPVGKSIYQFSKQNILSDNVLKPGNTHHAGISGTINGDTYNIGSMTLMNDLGISTTTLEEKMTLDAGDSLVFVAKNNKLVGYFIMTDPLREDAIRLINTLDKKIKKILCTGADEKTALRYARSLGITEVYADAVATSLKKNDRSKPALIRDLQSIGHQVAMVGDGANDAPALAASNVGIAVLSQGSDELTQQQAGVIVQNNNLMSIATAFAVSKQTVANIKQNLFFSLGYNIAAVLLTGGLLVAAGLVLNPAVGVALMAVQATLILLNVYRFKKQSLGHSPQETKSLEKVSSSHQLILKHTPEVKPEPTNEKKDILTSTPLADSNNEGSHHKVGRFFTSKKIELEKNTPREDKLNYLLMG